MLFNSVSYWLFLPIVFFGYWFVTKKSLRAQNIFLLIASYFFYSCWDWRFLFLLMFSTLLDYFTGIKIFEANSTAKKKFWLWTSIIVNLGFLGFFKYYNFFVTSFADFLSAFGLRPNVWTLKIILPVGISFYTFHGLSYVIDIYKNKIQPERNFIDYSLFVSFFPLLVAGPIERATHLLPQLKKERTFDYSKAVDGLRQILWGLFKKVVIADSCAIFADDIFNNYGGLNGSTLFIGLVFFTFQIYGDFSGYSDIALGTARLFGIELLRNFAFPYFSRDVAEFWRRWHISLNTWFRDYLYIPLGGSKTASKWVKVRNTFAIFLVSGFWHGANWTFIIWGFFNALAFLPLLLLNRNRKNLETVAQGKLFPTLGEVRAMFTTMMFVVFVRVFFRSPTVTDAILYLKKLFSASLFKMPDKKAFLGSGTHPAVVVLLIAIFMMIEWLGRENRYAIEKFGFTWPKPVRWAFYYILMLSVFLLMGKEQQFIYFQF